MTDDSRNRIAPWAKALGAIVGLVWLFLAVTFFRGEITDNRREDAAFEETVDQARRHVDLVLEQPESFLASEAALRELLRSLSHSREVSGTLFAFERKGREVTTVLRFREVYEQTQAIFAPTSAVVHRCFTITYQGVGIPDTTADITPHGQDESCTEVARRFG